MARMFLQIGKHKRTIDALETQKELEVNVTVTETTDTVTLENGKRMASSRINVLRNVVVSKQGHRAGHH